MFEVRQLDAADAADYRDIRLEALEACPESFGSSHAEDAGLPLVRFREIVSENVVFGGFQGPVLQGVVGFARPLSLKTRHKGTLWGLYVREHARGMGLADELIKAVLAYAGTRVEILQLRVPKTNEPAIRVFTRHRFQTWGTEPRALRTEANDYFDACHMYRLLKDSPPSAQ